MIGRVVSGRVDDAVNILDEIDDGRNGLMVHICGPPK